MATAFGQKAIATERYQAFLDESCPMGFSYHGEFDPSS
ncbi:hypothetical protein GGP54_003439, partial [Salinibacter ruber]|nr:hypothetical protein [Salinibacter ruber]